MKKLLSLTGNADTVVTTRVRPATAARPVTGLAYATACAPTAANAWSMDTRFVAGIADSKVDFHDRWPLASTP